MNARTETPWLDVASESGVTADRPHAAACDGQDLVLIRTGNAIHAYDARCPHQGTLLTEGEIQKGELVCRGHGFRFDLATGVRTNGQPRLCLRPYPVKVEAGRVHVKLEAAPGAPPRATRSLEDLPGPRPWPIVGNALQVELSRLHEQLEAWAQQYGPLYRLSFMGQPILVISDAKLGEPLLRARPQALRRVGPVEPTFVEVGAAGVFSAEGDAWRAQRRLAMQALSNRHIRGFFPTLRRVSERLWTRWRTAAGASAEVDIQDELMRFTVDVTTSLVFSTDMNTLGGGNDVLQRHLSHVFPALARRLAAPFPYWRYVKLPADRALDRALREIRRMQDEIVAQARARLAERGQDGEAHDFLEAMLLARDEDGKPFSDDVVYGNMLTMLLAGEDTTAHTLSWVVHYLCDRPDVVERMRSEVDQILGDDPTPSTFEAASNLPFLEAVANETMRLRPVAPVLSLEAVQDLVVDDVFVPKGTWLDVLTRLPALDAKHFDDPTSFRPERWLERQTEGAHVPGVSIPFGSGPRTCPGRSLALLEMRVVLATLVKNFAVERVGSADDVREHFAFAMGPRGLRVRLRERAVS